MIALVGAICLGIGAGGLELSGPSLPKKEENRTRKIGETFKFIGIVLIVFWMIPF